MVRFVFLDVGGTLIRPHPSVGSVYARAGQKFGLRATPAELTQAFTRRYPQYMKRNGPGAFVTNDETTSRCWWMGLVREVLLDVQFTGDPQPVFEACYSAFDAAEAWWIFEDVRPTLRALAKRGLRLGILSNWDHRLARLLERLELKDAFDEFVVSCDVGHAKPDPRLFAYAARRASAAPAEIVHVGDRPDLDLRPAQEAGWHAFLIDRNRDAPDRTASTLDSLAALTVEIDRLG